MSKWKGLTLFFISLLKIATACAMAPWFTGPLLAPGGQTVAAGHINFEPYITFTDSFGMFNNHWQVSKVPDTKTLSAMPVITAGLTDYMDLQLVAPYNLNSKQGQKDKGIGDTTISVGIQAYKQRSNHWLPSLRITFNELLPTGKYENLDPAKNGIDATGGGAYKTSVGLNFQQLTQPFSDKYLRTRLALSAIFPYAVHVNNFNAYGGGIGTNGNLKPGVQVQGDLAFEYQLNQSWVGVFETTFMNRQRSSFIGNPGRTLSGMPATIGSDEADQIILAPAIEYNINERFGIIGGAWFSITGKESAQFVTAAVAINYYC